MNSTSEILITIARDLTVETIKANPKLVMPVSTADDFASKSGQAAGDVFAEILKKVDAIHKTLNY